MPVVTPVTIAPFPPSSSSMKTALQEWDRGIARVNNEASKADGGIVIARRGAIELVNDARAIGMNTDEVVRGVAAANPHAEGVLAAKAAGNREGVSRTISEAQNNAQDPTVPAPRPNMGSVEASVSGGVEGIRARGRNIGGQAGQGDDLENLITSPKQ